MNDFQSRWDTHVDQEDLNADVMELVAIIKKNLEELGV